MGVTHRGPEVFFGNLRIARSTGDALVVEKLLNQPQAPTIPGYGRSRVVAQVVDRSNTFDARGLKSLLARALEGSPLDGSQVAPRIAEPDCVQPGGHGAGLPRSKVGNVLVQQDQGVVASILRVEQDYLSILDVETVGMKERLFEAGAIPLEEIE